MELICDERRISPDELMARPHARSMTVEECLPLLASPDSSKPLSVTEDGAELTDGTHRYELRGGLPLLIPARLQPFFDGRLSVPFEHFRAEYLQYFLMATIKQSGDVNAPASSLPWHRHILRVSEFLASCRGPILDIGCDNPALSAAFLPVDAVYVGLDPFCARTEPFRVIGLGEFLPFLDNSVENAVFNTSLDHIMDWHLAVEEAVRVLKPGGSLYLLSYAWTERADLLRDTVHFHHFRDYELLGKMAELGLTIVEQKAFQCPKEDTHRYELFIRATKP